MDKKKSPTTARERPSISDFTQAKLERAASPAVLDTAQDLRKNPFMIKRLKDGNEISCTLVTFDGNIHCAVSARKYSLQEMCTCEATYFCRHAAALVLTYLDDPESFLDLEAFLDGLQRLDKDELVEMLRQMVSRYPASSLEVLGLPGFQPADVLEEPDDDEFPFEEIDPEAAFDPADRSSLEGRDVPGLHDDFDDDDPGSGTIN